MYKFCFHAWSCMNGLINKLFSHKMLSIGLDIMTSLFLLLASQLNNIIICRSGVTHTNVLLRGAVFRTFSINFFTYGFPVHIHKLHLLSPLSWNSLSHCYIIIIRWKKLLSLKDLNSFLAEIHLIGIIQIFLQFPSK